MSRLLVIQSPLLATKFYVPTSPGTLISRPRLSALLAESLKYPLTLVSAPAGFGKTMLLSAWTQSLPPGSPLVGWVSLDEEDNDPLLFWTYALSALDQQQPERFTQLLKYLQSPATPPLMNVLTMLINRVLESAQHFVLILDDYHLITEQQVHTTLSYLVEHPAPQLHIILATRADPPLPLSLLRTRGQLLEVRTSQLRCTAEETKAFLDEVMGLQLPDDTIQTLRSRLEGWLVGLQLLALSLRGRADPATLLEEASGNQRYIFDFLTDEVLQRQPQDVQTFLLSTCILERLTASLCDTVMLQPGSQQMLHQIEQANLFVVSLDNKREWYRYHALFAEALRYRLEQMYPDLVLALHHRASLWYSEHNQTTQAILHAFSAKEWQWAADLIERIPVATLTWGANRHALATFQQWLEQLPRDVLSTRPRLCLACAQLLWAVVPHSKLHAWLNMAERALTPTPIAHPDEESHHLTLTPQTQQDLLGEVICWRAFMKSFEPDEQATFLLTQQACALLSKENVVARVVVGWAQLLAYYTSATNDATAAVESGLQHGSLAQTAGQTTLAISVMGSTALSMIGAGRLHEALQLTEQAIQLGNKSEGLTLPDVSYPALLQAEILREWNELDAARTLAEEAICVCEQIESPALLIYLLYGNSILLRIFLSRGELDAAHAAFQQIEYIGANMNQSVYTGVCSRFATIDQVRLWLARGELKLAMLWAERLDIGKQYGTPFAHEQAEVARVHILLAKAQPDLALQRLEPVLLRATVGKRWNDVIGIRLLQALAHQMCHQDMQALDALSEAVRLAEPEGYIRRFVDEGVSMAALLSQLAKDRPMPYLDRILVAFPQESKRHARSPKWVKHKP
jgi:LuxR family transcriptional regulator, maltose regulon positive regulatory protein